MDCFFPQFPVRRNSFPPLQNGFSAAVPGIPCPLPQGIRPSPLNDEAPSPSRRCGPQKFPANFPAGRESASGEARLDGSLFRGAVGPALSPLGRPRGGAVRYLSADGIKVGNGVVLMTTWRRRCFRISSAQRVGFGARLPCRRAVSGWRARCRCDAEG